MPSITLYRHRDCRYPLPRPELGLPLSASLGGPSVPPWRCYPGPKKGLAFPDRISPTTDAVLWSHLSTGRWFVAGSQSFVPFLRGRSEPQVPRSRSGFSQPCLCMWRQNCWQSQKDRTPAKSLRWCSLLFHPPETPAPNHRWYSWTAAPQ